MTEEGDAVVVAKTFDPLLNGQAWTVEVGNPKELECTDSDSDGGLVGCTRYDTLAYESGGDGLVFSVEVETLRIRGCRIG